MMIRHMVLVLNITACASNQTQPPPVLPEESAVARPRHDCPNGAAPLSDSRDTACWPITETNPPASHCRPERCPDTGYMLWSCPNLEGLINPDTGELEEASEPTTTTAPAEVEHRLTSRPVDCGPGKYLVMGVDGREHCEKIVRGTDGCPFGTMRTDSRGRTACLNGDVDLAKWPLESAVSGPCTADTQYECWYFGQEAPQPTRIK